MPEKLRCAYCLHESEPGDAVELFDRKRWKKQIALCVDSIKCLNRQLKARGISYENLKSLQSEYENR